MPVQIYPQSAQARGQFNGGAILENKPIGFPGEGGSLRPYSNLFYWAHAWSDHGSTIGQHPHRGFEIMSFVLEGTIDHYDNKHNAWKPLKKGDVQIIRSGNGIEHAERLNAGSHIFQIWVDPNLNKALQQEASYDDYTSDQFPVSSRDGLHITTYHGQGAPLQMDAEGLEIMEIRVEQGAHELAIDREKIQSLYVIQGDLRMNDLVVSQDDFLLVQEEDVLKLEVPSGSARLFMIVSQVEVSYPTYAEMRLQGA